MSDYYIGPQTFRIGAVYGFNDDRHPRVSKIVGMLQTVETKLQGQECSLIVECANAINRQAFLDGLSAADNIKEAVRFTLKVRGIGYGCEIVRLKEFGEYL